MNTLDNSNISKLDEKAKATISVIVPTYRRPDELERCLKALEVQTRFPDQVVVTVRPDDTKTLDRLESFKRASTLPLNIALVSIPGLIAAYNTGFRNAWGDIICLTDDDARPHPDWLERISRHYEDPKIGGVGGRDMVYTDGELEDRQVKEVGKLNWFGRRQGNHHLDLKGGKAIDVFTLKGVNSSYRRTLMRDFDKNLRGLPEMANEDDMGMNILKQGYRLIYDPKVLVDHFPSSHRPDSRGRAANFNKNQMFNVNHNYTYVLLKHLPPWRKVFFLLYNFFVGEIPNLAIIRALYGIVTEFDWHYLQVLPAAYAGKIAGIKTYLRYQAELKEQPKPGSAKTGDF